VTPKAPRWYHPNAQRLVLVLVLVRRASCSEPQKHPLQPAQHYHCSLRRKVDGAFLGPEASPSHRTMSLFRADIQRQRQCVSPTAHPAPRDLLAPVSLFLLPFCAAKGDARCCLPPPFAALLPVLLLRAPLAGRSPEVLGYSADVGRPWYRSCQCRCQKVGRSCLPCRRTC
jgi:hypothetical protein